MRSSTLKEWLIDNQLSERLSGTVKKNARIGMKFQWQLLHEALCQTLWWWFEIMPSTYITFNDAITEWDCHSLTEAWRHIDRLLNIHIFPEDVFETKYINIQDQAGNIERQWVWIVVKQTSIQRIGKWKLVFALLTEFDPVKKSRSPCVNPF